ncbi:MAG: 23S rRNA (adenine(2503)-C(2))-methyltransferase RlmN [Deltaproteobacteria bacterium]|nr:23S rRNA (adenine(2503)-C(2))-methyltransferase RlmN [Deltaproteobacteria bacterium]
MDRLPSEWEAVLESMGEPPYRAVQVFRWIHSRGVVDPRQMTDLPIRLREKLREVIGVPSLQVVGCLQSQEDATRKFLLRTKDAWEIEAVLIPMAKDEVEEDGEGEVPQKSLPFTQCVSTQVGCAMGCAFCASGIAGLKRSLNAEEIIAQVWIGRSLLAPQQRLRNVVFMGMGEPLANYEALARSLVVLTHPDGIGLGKRRITVSTAGWVPGIDRLGKDFMGEVQLAVSLHAPTDELRTMLMPINRRYPLGELIDALRRYPLPPRRRITIEYTLIGGVNDSPMLARDLLRLLRGIRVKVNLIPWNPIDGVGFQVPSEEAVESFQDILCHGGIPTFRRQRKGADIDAACGQLALKGNARRVRIPLWVSTSLKPRNASP